MLTEHLNIWFASEADASEWQQWARSGRSTSSNGGW
jgi:hypothetical protein